MLSIENIFETNKGKLKKKVCCVDKSVFFRQILIKYNRIKTLPDTFFKIVESGEKLAIKIKILSNY